MFTNSKKDYREKKTSKADLHSMPLEKLQEMINQKLNEAKHKYSAVMKYSITQNWSLSLSLILNSFKYMFIKILFL